MINFIVGCDISKGTIHFHLTQDNVYVTHGEWSNDTKTLNKKVKSIKNFVADIANDQSYQLTFVMEFTGIYNNLLLFVLHKYGIDTWIEHASTIKATCGIDRLKTDKIDAEKIALYGFRFRDKTKLWKPLSKDLEKLNVLITQREAFIKTKRQLTQANKDNKKFLDKHSSDFLLQLNTPVVDELVMAIAKLEDEMISLIANNSELKENYDIVVSVPGIGPVTARTLLTTTDNFTKFETGKKLGCYSGVVPFEKSSGALKGKAKVSHKANKKIKTLLHMGAVSASHGKSKMAQYYNRKIAEGKNKMSVINALRNKILITAFACVKNKCKYQDDYMFTFNVEN